MEFESEEKINNVISKILLMSGMTVCFYGGSAYKAIQFKQAQSAINQEQLALYAVPRHSKEVSSYNSKLLFKMSQFYLENNAEPTPADTLKLMMAHRDDWISYYSPNRDTWSAEQKILYNYATNMINVWAKQNNLNTEVTSHRSNASRTQMALNKQMIYSR